MSTEKKLDMVIDILSLVPLVARGVQGAVETFQRMYAGLKDGTVTDEEWAALRGERDAALENLIAITAPEPSPVPEPEPAPAA